MTINKNFSFGGFCCSCRPQYENVIKRKGKQILGSCLRVEKAVKGGGDTDNSRFIKKRFQELGKETGGIGNLR